MLIRRVPRTFHGRWDRKPALLLRSELYVPSEGLGGISPERKAAKALKKLCTFCAASAVMAQLEGSGRGSLASYNVEGYNALRDSISELSGMNCDNWLKQLSQKDRSIAVRVMDVRLEYCKDEFEWDNCKKLTTSLLENENLNLMRDIMESTSVFEE